MHITPTERTIVEYTLALDLYDIERLRDDPETFGRELRAALEHSATNPDKARVNGRASGHEQRKPGRRSRAGAPNPKGAQAATTGGLARVTCPVCGREIAQKYLPNHLAKKHGPKIQGSRLLGSLDQAASAATSSSS